ncbi:MAG: HD domain-containing protein [Sulfuricurvum sp.]|nr:HD domain-containing protein [Sulfuricurvum sp.]
MARIVQRDITNKYIPYKLDILVKETILSFDCYIKRHGDYVIIIEAGTYISKALLEKIDGNKAVYVVKTDSEKVNKYRIDHEIIDLPGEKTLSEKEVVKAALDLSETLCNVIGTFKERLSLVYTTTSNLMQTIDNVDEKLPLDALHACVIQLVKCVNLEMNMIPMLFNIIPDEYTTHYHSTNVAFFAVILANSIHLSEEEIIDIGFAGLLHDIGKIRIAPTILLKPTRLDEEEYKSIKYHPEFGYEILKDNGITNQRILNGVRFHHERLDGSGYPKGLRGKLIPKYARVLGMCDAFDALTTKRTFRNNYSSYEALLVMKQEMVFQFDKDYINTFIQLLRQH